MACGLRDAMKRCVETKARFRFQRSVFIFSITDMAANKTTMKKDKEIFERQARICRAFAHPGRLQILDLLGQGERGSSELQDSLGISKTSISQHLSVLRAAGVLTTRRKGKQIYCSLAMPEVKQACKLIRKVLEAHIAESRRLIL
jgi:ArsR family transcriptional regulator